MTSEAALHPAANPRPPGGTEGGQHRHRHSPGVRRFLWIFSVLMVLIAGSAFIMKLVEFYTTATTHGPEALGSFLIPVLNYLLVATGFFSLFLWAYATGQFRDVEGPKYRMLELQEEIDRQEERQKTLQKMAKEEPSDG